MNEFKRGDSNTSYLDAYRSATRIKSSGRIFVPEGYTGEKAIIIPDEVVEYCAREFGLLAKAVKTIDPMCGVGTIPRVINKLGGDCMGVEIDEERYEAAVKAAGPGKIFLGDFKAITLPRRSFRCIFTSMPLAWFKDAPSALLLDPSFANTFSRLLTKDGLILIDSLPVVERQGEVCHPAESTCAYFEHHNFLLDEIIVFENKTHIDKTEESVIMKFNKEKS